MNKNVLAIVAHPDDIEFVMSGTLKRFHSVGWNIHYFNLANGCCGSMQHDRPTTSEMRLEESKAAARHLDAVFYPPITDDMGIYYNPTLLAQVASVVRKANPQIVLTHSPVDYMEDHEATCRLAVSATFVKAMPNFICDPPTPPRPGPVAIYHAQPHGNQSPLNEPIIPKIFINVEPVIEFKKTMLAEHRSQQGWLDQTQHMSSYIEEMVHAGREVGRLSQVFSIAEGFRKHSHTGFSDRDFSPLESALSDCCFVHG